MFELSLSPSQYSTRTKFLLGGMALWLITLSGIFGNRGLIQAYRLSSARHDLVLRVKAIESERDKLGSQLKALYGDKVTQEKAIRETLGFVRENELVFEFR